MCIRDSGYTTATGAKNVNLFKQGRANKGIIESYDLFGSSVALSGDGKVLAVGAVGDDGFAKQQNYVAGYERKNSGGVYMIAFDDADFTNGRVVSLIGYGYEESIENLNSNCFSAGKCTIFDNDVNTKKISDIKPFTNSINGIDNDDDEFGTSVSLDHTGTLLAVGHPYDDGKNNVDENSGAVRLFKFMSGSNIVSAATGIATYVGSIGEGYSLSLIHI